MARGVYTGLLRRRREGKTDYRKRKKIIISRRNYIAIRISDRNTNLQISSARIEGDLVLASAHSVELRNLGWNGSGKSIPAAYLTGLLAGQRARKAGVQSAIVYSGVKPLRSGSRVAAAVKGVIDSGIDVNVDKKMLPPEGRIKGDHIAGYASSLEGSGATAQFSTWEKSNLSAESFGRHFAEILPKVKEGE